MSAARADGAASRAEAPGRGQKGPQGPERVARDAASERREGFRVLGPRELAERARRRQVLRLASVSVGVVLSSMLVVAGAQALVASRQVRIDALQQQLGAAVATDEQLSLRKASLEEPGRILAIAERRLHMVPPGTVSYLAPVDPGPPVGSRAASIPVPPAISVLAGLSSAASRPASVAGRAVAGSRG